MDKISATKDRIIAAAQAVMTRSGLAGATIKAIAREAGIAPGLVHYHFEGKDDLLAAVVRRDSERMRDDMAALRRQSDDQGDAFLVRSIGAVARRTIENADFYRLRFEFYPMALNSERFRAVIQQVLAEARAGIARSIEMSGFDDSFDRDALAAVLYAAFDGIALQSLLDPDFEVDRTYRTLIAVIRAFRDGAGRPA